MPASRPPGTPNQASSIEQRNAQPFPYEAPGPCIGRTSEIAAIEDLLGPEHVRLLTLTGPGGIGKTRLAIEAARSLLRDHTWFDAVRFVPLDGVSTSDMVIVEIAKALDIRDGGAIPLVDAIGLVIRNRRMLVILDTFEHVTDAGIDLARLLDICPELSILATSRAPLRVYGEQLLTVEPLALGLHPGPGGIPTVLPDAVALLVERIRAYRPDFVLTPESYAIAADICRQMEGIPLAIELAASHARALTLAELRHRLGHHPAIHGDSPYGIPTRQQSIEEVVAWSYNLLPAEDRRMLRWLSVVPAGFTIATVEAISEQGGNRHPLTSLSSLVDSSLIRQLTDDTGDVRFTLYDAVREFGLEQLAFHEETDDAYRSLVRAHIAFAREVEPHLFRGIDLPRHLARIDAELNNLRASMSWADRRAPHLLAELFAPLGQYWLRHSMLQEGRLWAERIIAHGDLVPSPLRLRAMIDLSRMMTYQSAPGVAALHDEAMALAHSLNDVDSQLAIIVSRMVAALIQRNPAAAYALFEEATRMEATRSGSATTGPGRSQAVRGLAALAAVELGNLEVAATLARGCQNEAQATNDVAVMSIVWRAFGGIASTQGRHDTALGYFQNALQAYHRVGERWMVAVVIVEIAWELSRTMPHITAQLFGIADQMRASLGLPPIEAHDPPFARWRGTSIAPISADRWTDAYAAGRAMDAATAIAFVRTLPDEVAAKEWSDAIPRQAQAAQRCAPFRLSAREREVITLISEGLTDREIAARLGISYRTTTTYVASIFAKLDVGSRAAAAALAVRLGLDMPDI